jgi:hypothetical protein
MAGAIRRIGRRDGCGQAPRKLHATATLLPLNEELGKTMRKHRILLALLFGFFCQDAAASSCGSYAGTPVPMPKELAEPVAKVIKALKNKSSRELLSLAGRHLLLIRRSLSENSSERTANVRLMLRPTDIDAQLNIHIGNQIFPDLADPSLFNAIDPAAAVLLDREVCEGAEHCDDQLPPSVEVPFLLTDMLRCNPASSRVIAFTDGAFVVDMKASSNRMFAGVALFFTKDGKGYRFSSLIIQR